MNGSITIKIEQPLENHLGAALAFQPPLSRYTSPFNPATLDDKDPFCDHAALATGDSLYRCERGSVSILVLFMGLLIFALAAMVWNTGLTTTAKMEAQTAADSASYASAVWTSRAINMITATNMIALRDASALGVSVQVMATWIPLTVVILANLITTGIAVVSAAVSVIATFGATAPALALAVVQFTIALLEFVNYLLFTIATEAPVTPVLDAIALGKHLGELREYQESWVRVIPGLIEAQRQQFEAYYDCDISLQLGNGSRTITAPLHAGSFGSCAVPIGLRFLYDSFAKGSWNSSTEFKLMPKAGAKKFWLLGAVFGMLAATPALALNHHVLSTTAPNSFPPFFEVGPSGKGFSVDPQTWEDYAIVAVARKRMTNDISSQRPNQPLAYMAPGLFTGADQLRPVAYSQAEAFNPVDGLLSTLKVGGVSPGQIIGNLYPWRVWTDWGWHWQSRLTHGTLLNEGAFADQNVTLTPFGRASAQH
ncbi:MAG: hypothetical protein ACI8TQ_000902 [Planctomycetota bacterium]|jgi:hypothetical protein